MSQPSEPTVADTYGLPEYWPSAWPSLRGRVIVAAVFPLVACVVATVIFVLTGVVLIVWWVGALPLLLLIAPLTLPSRTRSAIQRAADRQVLQVSPGATGLVVRTPRRHGIRPIATVEVTQDGGYAVAYHVR